jgi:hypothetical protein
VSRVSWRLVRTLRNLGFDGTLKSFSGQRYPPQSPSAYSSSKIAFSHKVQLHVNEKRGRERKKDARVITGLSGGRCVFKELGFSSQFEELAFRYKMD